MRVDSILFDLDGTLWNATYSTAKFFEDRLKELGYDLELKQPLIQSVMGLQVHEIAEIYFKDYPAEERLPMMLRANTGKSEYLSAHGGILYPDVEKTLKTLASNYKLFIVSNCSEEYLDAFYKAHQLDRYILDFENSGRTGKSKAENIRMVVERHNLKSPVYVGDIEKDRLAANEANVPFVYAGYGFGEVHEYAAKIDQFSQLINVVETLEV